MNVNNLQTNRLNARISIFAFFCFYLFDNYHYEIGFRVLDVVGLITIIFCYLTFLFGRTKKLFIPKIKGLFPWIVLFYGLTSLVVDLDNFKPVLGVLLGLLFLCSIQLSKM